MSEEEIFETNEETELDWDGYLTEGLMPVSRVHVNILKAEVRRRKDRETGEDYKQISIQYEIDRHEVLGADYPGEGKKNQTGWLNFYMRGKTAQRFRNLYSACTGRAMQPTGRNPETGKPTVNMEAVVADLPGLGCFTAVIWRKQDDGSYEDSLAWNFAQSMEEISVPTIKKEE